VISLSSAEGKNIVFAPSSYFITVRSRRAFISRSRVTKSSPRFVGKHEIENEFQHRMPSVK
jgi:hypothetical protein